MIKVTIWTLNVPATMELFVFPITRLITFKRSHDFGRQISNQRISRITLVDINAKTSVNFDEVALLLPSSHYVILGMIIFYTSRL